MGIRVALCMVVVVMGGAIMSVSAQAVEAKALPEGALTGHWIGPYATGTEEELWIDDSRFEATSEGGQATRRLMLQVWYPASFAPDALRAPYILNPKLYSLERQVALSRHAHVRGASVRAAAILEEPRRFPVLLYNPGGGAAVFTGIVQAEFLASHGYVVVGIGHTGLNGVERFPDGVTYQRTLDPDPRPSEIERASLSEEEMFRRSVKNYSERMMPVHMQDLRFVLDRLARANRTPGNRFYQRLDLERVGALGWSLGGALSLQASRDEPRIRAAVNLDGWLFTDVAETGTSSPVLQIRTGPVAGAKEGADIREVEAAAESRYWRFYARSRGPWYDVVLPRSRHGHFSSDSLLRPHDTHYLHPHLAHEIINRYTLEFFDRYLRASDESPLLEGRQSFDEATFLCGCSEKR